MTVGFIDGFDRYPDGGGGVGVRGVWIFGAGGALTAGRVGGQAYTVNLSIDPGVFYRPVPASNQYSVFFAFKHDNYIGNVVNNFMSLRNTTDIEVIGLAFDNIDNLIVRVRGVDVATLPLTCGPDVWHGFNVCYEQHASLGKLQIRLNGELLVNLTNINTTFQSGVNAVQALRFSGKPTSGVGGATYFDDIRLDYDTFVAIPEGRVSPKFPNGDLVAGWSRLSGASNYLMVDEVTCDRDTTYNYSTVKNTKDEYQFGVLGFNPDKIHAVQVVYAARKDDASTRVVGCKLKSGAAAPAMDPNYLATDYGWHEKVFVAADFAESEITLAMLNAMTVEFEDLGDGT